MGKIYKIKKIILAASIYLLLFLTACNDQASLNKPSAPEVVSGAIPPPVTQNQEVLIIDQAQTNPTGEKVEVLEKEMPVSEAKNDVPTQEPIKDDEKKIDNYDAKGKIDPFLALIQEKVEDSQPVFDDQPQRILTPLEKIELNQVRLVAVVITENKRIAMVEESTGKGHEITVGTYIGRNQGKVTEINDSSITVTELVKDFKGKLQEKTQEIKLHKNDEE